MIDLIALEKRDIDVNTIEEAFQLCLLTTKHDVIDAGAWADLLQRSVDFATLQLPHRV